MESSTVPTVPRVQPQPPSTEPTASRMRNAVALEQVERLMLELATEQGAGVAPVLVREHLATGGKRLRARLALAAAEALGCPRDGVVPWAAACELLHNGTLVHDDLQDGDRTRRGHPTVWARHGIPQALNAGDLLFMLPFLALERLAAPDATRWQLSRALAVHAATVICGQAAELALTTARDVRWESYLAAVEGKTSALFELPVEGAVLIAGRDPATARRLGGAFRPLGVLFQLQDDVLDLYGDKGREEGPGSDLREGKVSALVSQHLGFHPDDAPWLLDLLAAPRELTPEAGVQRAMERFRTGGALEAVLRQIESEAEATLGDATLRTEPELWRLAQELVEVTLAPIAHLTPGRTG